MQQKLLQDNQAKGAYDHASSANRNLACVLEQTLRASSADNWLGSRVVAAGRCSLDTIYGGKMRWKLFISKNDVFEELF